MEDSEIELAIKIKAMEIGRGNGRIHYNFKDMVQALQEKLSGDKEELTGIQKEVKEFAEKINKRNGVENV